jgi:D-alanyl-lipoteichoic acid acyltransferase DltB (MBOAT superfamily)
MLFNSLVFVAFFLLVYAGYLLLHRQTRWQNILLLFASYVFYGYWDWRFLSLIALSTLIDFGAGMLLGQADGLSDAGQRVRKRVVMGSVVANLTILGFFKYFGFFVDSAADVLHLLGMQADPATLNIVLPVGISFYTFQTMSYTIDVYRGRLEPTKDLLAFAVFVSFFPQLVAGPIERARNLLPQVASPRRITVEHVNTGLFLILWGYFKKVVVADNLALIANGVFNNYEAFAGLDLLLGLLAFSVQIYCDFSGYSDIARGIARLMGFELMVNFRLPYFALNPSDFWQRWHVSLSSWLRDYLYIPLGGNRGSAARTYRNLGLTMLLGGLWHGAAWNFVAWGGFHGLILMLYRRFERRPAHADPWGGAHHPAVVFAKLSLMTVLTLFGWLLFRSSSLGQIAYMITNMSLAPSGHSSAMAYDLVFFTLPLMAVQVYQYRRRDLLVLTKWRAWLRVPCYGLLFLAILIFGVRESVEFIYFQF